MKILIIDPHFITRSGLIHVITTYLSDVAIYEASTYAFAKDYLASGERFDLIFTELDLPDADYRHVVSRLQELSPDAHIVLFTWRNQTNDIQGAVSQGARSYLRKDSLAEDVKLAIHGLLQNRPYLPSETLQYREQSEAERKLSPRQREIMQLLAQGLSNKEIANILGITEGTIRVHLSAIFKAIKVSNRTEATLWYLLRQN
ncbi:LuxR C-terminal-related transcriptional regulator [Aliidiomarina indica]|uniref:LuxR C-terminal-related transcriptional regulator n=1 Tax=Aliidiomarina indica TaxID=2749147 RepID=UPI00188F2B9A|nr:response regulator transcription factor [Aliidiomarina indica]